MIFNKNQTFLWKKKRMYFGNLTLIQIDETFFIEQIYSLYKYQ